VTNVAVTGLFTLRLALGFILLVVFISIPAYAEASILSMVTSLFSSEVSAAGAVLPDNSQKMALLEAPVNSNVHPSTVVELHVDDSALVADMATDEEGTAFAASSNEIKTYKVQAGDTVSSIAKKYAISVNTIIWANGLSRTAALKEGQTLVILPISGVQHKVKSGDTLQGIATKYKGDIDEIMAYNDITTSSLKAGDIIVVPDGEIVTQTSSGSSVKVSAPSITQKITSAALGVRVATADNDTGSYYIRPLNGGVKTQGIHGNNGVDLAASCGTPLYASAAGEVIVSKNDDGYNGGYGNYIVITHSNGSQTLYGHMQNAVIPIGATVSQGQYIGTLGNTGKVHGVTGCHVHFEIRNGIRNPF
jgi:murein DD-endopeptidase MepM/ murein hydrolase activator NlpD